MYQGGNIGVSSNFTAAPPSAPIVGPLMGNTLPRVGPLSTSRVATAPGRSEETPFAPLLLKTDSEAARPTLTREAGAEAFVAIVGESPAIRQALERAQRAAASQSTVLLLGESGTGKEVFARAMHAWSPRHRHPLIVVNCAALSEELVASELFGHEKGAFTGAHQRRLGKLELADGGTVFLDEIGEMSPTLQTKLLRVLQDRAFERVGGAVTIRSDIRIIAATNRDLGHAIQDGRFREDLFFRLNVIPITLPPLRERRSDIPFLAESFLKKLADDLRRPGLSLSRAARESLVHYDWPGNVRELHNLLERAAVLSGRDMIGPEELALPQTAGPGAAPDYGARLDVAEREVLLQALRDHGGDKRAAARAMGIALSTLYAWLKKHHWQSPMGEGLRPPVRGGLGRQARAALSAGGWAEPPRVGQAEPSGVTHESYAPA